MAYMEEKLRLLFDYQKFQKNPALQKIITMAEEHYEVLLSDDDLEYVSAAGEAYLPKKEKETKEQFNQERLIDEGFGKISGTDI